MLKSDGHSCGLRNNYLQQQLEMPFKGITEGKTDLKIYRFNSKREVKEFDKCQLVLEVVQFVNMRRFLLMGSKD